MTFPRRLTPSDKERATIVQQRMTPGGALGVGSRHVRSGSGPTASSQATAGGGVVAAATYTTTAATTKANAASGDFVLSLDPSEVTWGDYSGYISLGSSVNLDEIGSYQVSVYAKIANATAGDVWELELDIPNVYLSDGVAKTAAPCYARSHFTGGIGTVLLLTTPIFNTPYSTLVQPTITGPVGAAGDVDLLVVTVVKIAD